MTLEIFDCEQLFEIDAVAGRIFWKNPPKNHPRLKGVEAGCPRLGRNGKIYWIIKINGRPHYRGHLIFTYMNGRPPHPLLDHRDGDSLNDKIDNLRDATHEQNVWNRKRRRSAALPMGVRRFRDKFQARIVFRKKYIHLGTFNTAEMAEAAYLSRRRDLYGDFA